MLRSGQVQYHQKPRIAWIWEIAAAVCSLATLVGMIIVLALNDGKEVFTWHGATLNAVVSLLSTAGKTMLLYSLGESIGQWKWVAFSKEPRSLIDLERIGFRKSWTTRWGALVVGIKLEAKIAALITLLAVAVDPFSQQLIQYEQKLKSSSDGAASIAHAQQYSRGTTSVPTILPITMTAIADYSLQAGIFNALIQPYDALVQQTVFACPTGNCTWSPFKSLAICSTCNDVADQLSSHNESSYLYNSLRKRLYWNYVTPNATSFQLPDGLYINNMNGVPYHKPEDYSPLTGNRLQTVAMTFFGTGNSSRTNSFRNSDNLLWAMSFLKMQASSNDTFQSDGWPNIPLQALECGLFYCVNRYTSSVRKGVLYETETLMQNAVRDAESWKLIGYSEPNLDNIHIDNHTLNSLEFNNSTSSVSRTDLMFGDGFNFSWASVNSLSNQLKMQFTSEMLINDTNHQNFSAALDYTPINGFYRNEINDYNPTAVKFSPSVMQILYDSPDLNDTFRRLARGMSNAIRAGADDSPMQIGTSEVNTIYYRVQWPWIALRIILAFGGISFLLAIMLESRRTGAPIWKSSALSTLSLLHEIGDILVGLESVEDMKAKASQHFVQLFKARGGNNIGPGQP